MHLLFPYIFLWFDSSFLSIIEYYPFVWMYTICFIYYLVKNILVDLANLNKSFIVVQGQNFIWTYVSNIKWVNTKECDCWILW